MKYMFVVCLFALTACTGSGKTRGLEREFEGDTSERVARVSAAIAKHKAPPTPILDAHFLEEATGDSSRDIGPVDYTDFYHIKVAPQDVEKWTRILTPSADRHSDGEAPPFYAQPRNPRAWWVSREDFDSLELYKPDTLTIRRHGWIGVSRRTGHIYIYAYTM